MAGEAAGASRTPREDQPPQPGIASGVGAGAVALPVATAAGTAAGLSATMPALGALRLAGESLQQIMKMLRRFHLLMRARQRWAAIKLWQERGLPVVSAVPDTGTATHPDLAKLVADEDHLGAVFQQKSEERVMRLATAAILLPPTERRAALDRIQAQEERYARQRSEAQAVRMFAAVDREYIRRVSPEGAVWILDPNVKQHTLDCLAAAKVGFWPWDALAVLFPPVHAGCRCRLEDPKEAERKGLWTPGRKLATAEYVTLMRAIAAMPHDH
jgi:hypothetical protein